MCHILCDKSQIHAYSGIKHKYIIPTIMLVQMFFGHDPVCYQVMPVVFLYLPDECQKILWFWPSSSAAISSVEISIVYQVSKKIFITAFPNLVGTYPRG